MTTTNNTSVVQTSSSGRTYITGTVSGLDTQALINAALAKKTSQVTALTDRVTLNNNKFTTFLDIRTLANKAEIALSALKSSSNTTGITLGGYSFSNVFNTKAISYTTSDGSTAGNILSATTDSSAANGSHTVIVTKVAQAEQVLSDEQSSRTTPLNYNGTFDLNIDGKSAYTINVTAGQSLNDLKDTINAHSTTTGVTAEVLQSSPGKYKLVLNSTDTNKNIHVTAVTGDDVLSNLGVTALPGGAFSNISRIAQAATITFDGATGITSDTNTFSNIITGLSLNVSNTAPGTTVTIGVGNNISGVKTALNTLINTYNDLYDGIAAQGKINSDGTVDPTLYLHGNPTVKALSDSIKALVTSTGNNLTGVNSLGALGIIVGSDNHLTISKPDFLDDALNNHFASVQSLFATGFTSNNANLTLQTNNTNLNTGFTIQVNTDGAGTVTSASVGGDSTLFTVSGNKIIGKAGTAYAGLTLTYAALASASVNVAFQQGIADKATNAIDSFTNSNTGTIAAQLTQLLNDNTTLNQKSAKITADAKTLEIQLINKYAKLEADLKKSEGVSNLLTALLNASFSN